jgi:ornithine lipid ester-linked acyl 2-hydroxylase
MNKYKLLGLYNKYLISLAKKGVFNDAPFHDLPDSFPEYKSLEDNFSIISREFQSLDSSIIHPTMVDVGLYGGNGNYNKLPWNDALKNHPQELNPPLNWRSIFIKLNGRIVDKYRLFFPETIALLEKVPNLINVFFSCLGPNTHISPHYGYLKGFLRYHLGVYIPYPEKSYLIVDNIRYHWQEGQSVIFDDLFLHSAHNESDKSRVVLFADLFRPMPFPYGQINKTVCKLAGNLSDELRAVRDVLK